MKRLLFLAAFQIVAILSWAAYHEHVWATAPTFRIPLRPRDPFDLIRGRYFVLNPLDTSVDPSTTFPEEQWRGSLVLKARSLAPSSRNSARWSSSTVFALWRARTRGRPSGRSNTGPRASRRFAGSKGSGTWISILAFAASSFRIVSSFLHVKTRKAGSSRSATAQGCRLSLARLLFRGRPIELR